MRCLFPMALLALAPAPLAAQPEGLIDAEIIQGGQMPDGRPLAAIVLTLAPDWKTYWRSAGEGGLPPVFDWAEAQNLGDVTYLWPTPQVFDIDGMRSFGYHDSLVLPLALTPDDAAQPMALQVTMSFGLCKDICLPAEVMLSAPLLQGAPSHPLIMAALAAQPMTAQAAGAANWACISTPIKDGVQVALTLPMPIWAGAGYEVVVVEHHDPNIWASPAQVRREGDILTAVVDLVPPQAKPFDLAGDDLRLTVLAGGKAAELQGCPLAP
jgi:DsbC/DsbD-like thiol-disulfide interchange protein